MYKEWREDKDENIALLVHLSHWLPSYGWESHPSEYQNTYGDLEKILIAFGKLVGELQSPSGAYIIPHYLRILGEERLLKYGEGVGMKGAAMEAFKGQTPLELTEKEIAEDGSYRDHVFFPIEGRAAYYALPAVPTPLEKGVVPPAQAAPAKADGSDFSGDKDKDKNKGKGKNTGKGKGANTGKK